MNPLSGLPTNPNQSSSSTKKNEPKKRTIGFNPQPPSSSDPADILNVESGRVSMGHVEDPSVEKTDKIAVEFLGVSSEPSILDRIKTAESQYEKIRNLWVNHEQKILEKTAEFYKKFDFYFFNDIPSVEELQKTRKEIYEDYNNLRNEYNIALSTLVEELEKNLNQIAELYNKKVDDRTTSEEELLDLEKKINALNSKKMQSHLTTSSQHAIEYKIIQFQGIVERKYNLVMKISNKETSVKEIAKVKAELRNEHLTLKKRSQLLKQGGILLKKIEHSKNEKEVKQLMQPKSISFFFNPLKWFGAFISRLSGIPQDLNSITKKLSYCPDSNELDTLILTLKNELKKPIKTLSTLDAMKSYKSENEILAWGEDSKHLALCNPAFWVDKYDVSLSINAKGRASVYETKIEPLNIESEGREASGYGSMMRSEGSRAANAQKTTLSIVNFDNNGNKVTTYPIERFRIGQFPTEEAALDAIKIILKNSSEKVTSLHDNMLLTASKFADKKLAVEHKKNLNAALEKIRNSPEILKEINKQRKEKKLEKYSRQDIANIQKNYMQTNFGVNEGAIGKMKVGVTLSAIKIGWKRAFKEFNNPSAKRYNRIIKDKLDKLSEKSVDQLDEKDMRLIERLGAIVQIGQELEEIWFREDYKNPDVGANQFKAPALLSVLDSLLEITVNTHCKSAKDRASMVEAHSLEVLQTIEANLADKRKELETQLEALKNNRSYLNPYFILAMKSGMYDKDSSEEVQEIQKIELIFSEKSLNLLSYFTFNEIEALYPSLIEALYPSLIGEKSNEIEKFISNEIEKLISKEVFDKIQTKIENAKKSLGLEENNGFLLPKKSNSKVRSLPLREIRTSKEAAEKFEQIAPTSLYQPWSFDSTKSASTEDLKLLIEVQRQKKNRRMACQLAMDVTKENTGVPGDKLKHGEPLRIFYSGFHRDYVRYQFFNTDAVRLAEELTDAMGLDEIDNNTKKQIIAKALKIKSAKSPLTKEDQLKQLNKLIKQVEKIKYRQFYPMAKVKS